MSETAKSKPERLEWVCIRRAAQPLPFTPTDTTEVARVAAGWLFKFAHFQGYASGLTGQVVTFVPDPAHAWDPKWGIGRWEKVGGNINANFNDWTARFPVHQGWVYKTTYVTRGKRLSLSMVYVPDSEGRSRDAETETQD
jgi:hypothetical protein